MCASGGRGAAGTRGDGVAEQVQLLQHGLQGQPGVVVLDDLGDTTATGLSMNQNIKGGQLGSGKLDGKGVPLILEFKTGDNPYKHKKNELTGRQIKKKKRLIERAKRGRR